MQMAMVDNIKRGVQKRSSVFDAQEELRQNLNLGFSEAMNQFIQKLQMGEIKIDNVADAIRVFSAYKELNGIDEMINGQQGAGMLPEINMRQEKVVDDMVREGTLGETEEGRIDIGGISDAELAKLLTEMDIAQNRANEESM
ncbi:terminase small subunit [Bacillus phage CAM003]|uniref:Terminase small subunit n=6 Tax=Bastillevirus TaxID=1918010 RepID=A0A143FJ07_9CAUD|nr:terminase small subunit [Bacillus phage Hoody T]YP_009036966.1 terminase small subunit [Bacillus phage CAM003]AHZ09500.1 hypothetical protein [Bacillus phage CAM003]AHZ10374.1 hypothetical protein [Bacillus phage Hoody T]AMW61818.1 hypothetical protein DNAM5_67 [Bacillus phage Vinny]